MSINPALQQTPPISNPSNFYTLEDEQQEPLSLEPVLDSFTKSINNLFFGGPIKQQQQYFHHICPHCNHEILPNKEEEEIIDMGDDVAAGNLYLHKKCFMIQKQMAKEEVKRIILTAAAAQNNNAHDDQNHHPTEIKEERHTEGFVQKIKRNLSSGSLVGNSSNKSDGCSTSQSRIFAIQSGRGAKLQDTFKQDSSTDKLERKEHASPNNKGGCIIEPTNVIIHSPNLFKDDDFLESVYREVSIIQNDIDDEKGGEYFCKKEEESIHIQKNRSILKKADRHPVKSSSILKQDDISTTTTATSSSRNSKRSIVRSNHPHDLSTALLESSMDKISNYFNGLLGRETKQQQCQRCQKMIQSCETRVDLVVHHEKIPYHEDCFEIQKILDREKLRRMMINKLLPQAEKETKQREEEEERKKRTNNKKETNNNNKDDLVMVESLLQRSSILSKEEDHPESREKVTKEIIKPKPEKAKITTNEELKSEPEGSKITKEVVQNQDKEMSNHHGSSSREIMKGKNDSKQVENKKNGHRLHREVPQSMDVVNDKGKNNTDDKFHKERRREISQDRKTEWIHSTQEVETSAIIVRDIKKINMSNKKNSNISMLDNLVVQKRMGGRKVGCM